MTTPDLTLADAVAGLPHAEAGMTLDVLVNSIAGTVGAVASIRPLSDVEIYATVSMSLLRMLEAESGPDLSRVILAAALTRLIRQKLEAGA